MLCLCGVNYALSSVQAPDRCGRQMLDLRVRAVRQSRCCTLEMYEKVGALGELLKIMLLRPSQGKDQSLQYEGLERLKLCPRTVIAAPLGPVVRQRVKS